MHMGARFLINAALFLVLGGGMIGVCAFALVKGRPAERYGAAMYGLAVLLSFAIEGVTGEAIPVLPLLLLDGLVAVGFLFLSIRYNNLWLGAAMMIKGVQLAVHATHLTDVDDPYFAGLNMYGAALDLVSLMILLTILGATLATVAERRKAKASAAAAAGQAT